MNMSPKKSRLQRQKGEAKRLPGSNLGTTAILPDKKTTQVIDNKGMGDTGFEPVTSTVCRKRRKKLKYSK
jgi:hypothetical protein